MAEDQDGRPHRSQTEPDGPPVLLRQEFAQAGFWERLVCFSARRGGWGRFMEGLIFGDRLPGILPRLESTVNRDDMREVVGLEVLTIPWVVSPVRSQE